MSGVDVRWPANRVAKPPFTACLIAEPRPPQPLRRRKIFNRPFCRGGACSARRHPGKQSPTKHPMTLSASREQEVTPSRSQICRFDRKDGRSCRPEAEKSLLDSGTQPNLMP
jgi:hypothetical protein